MSKTFSIAAIGSGTVPIHLFILINIRVGTETFVIVKVQVTLVGEVNLISFIQFKITLNTKIGSEIFIPE
ncbi:hypothetical protein D3C87_1878680 [compost metagenome]